MANLLVRFVKSLPWSLELQGAYKLKFLVSNSSAKVSLFHYKVCRVKKSLELQHRTVRLCRHLALRSSD